ncbi:hypothetical protein EBR21_17605, partial [bacterium]|nr:hypothetical protein [bacterium]
ETGKSRIQDLVDECISKDRPGDFNQAMMELGATVCQKLSPACGKCPVKNFCVAFRNDSVRTCPVPKPRKSFESVELDALSVRASNCEQVSGEAILLVGRAGGFLSETVGFPLFGQKEKQGLMRWLTELPIVKSSRVLEKTVSHTITNHQIQIRIVEVTLKQQSGIADDFIVQFKNQFPHLIVSSRWVSKSNTERSVASSLDRKIWENVSRF